MGNGPNKEFIANGRMERRLYTVMIIRAGNVHDLCPDVWHNG